MEKAAGLPEDEARALIAAACRVLQAAGQGDMVWGHVSVRDAEGRGVWLKGAGLGFDEVTEADCVLLSWDGDVLAGTASRHVEYPIHTELMAARPDVGGVVHTHPVHAIAFGALGRPLRALSHEGALFTPPDVPRFTRTGDVISTRAARPRPGGHAGRAQRRAVATARYRDGGGHAQRGGRHGGAPGARLPDRVAGRPGRPGQHGRRGAGQARPRAQPVRERLDVSRARIEKLMTCGVDVAAGLIAQKFHL